MFNGMKNSISVTTGVQNAMHDQYFMAVTQARDHVTPLFVLFRGG